MPIDLNDSSLEAQFSFGPESGSVIEEVPFHILFLGDWSGDSEGTTRRDPIEIDRDNYEEILAKLGTAVDLDFEDGSVIRLEFSSLDDFHPDEIFRRVPLFADLRKLRKELNNQDTYNIAAREARRLFGTAAAEEPVQEAPAEVPSDNLLDAILGKPEGGAAVSHKAKVSGELGSLISDLVRPHLITVDENEQASLISAADSATSGLMRKIITHPKFKALESSWRGLYFLTRRADTSTQLKVHILDLPKDKFASSLASADGLSSTELFRFLIHDAIQVEGAEPWALVAADYAFEPNVDDVAALMRISKLCSAAGAPFVAQMSAEILGVSSLAEHPDQAQWNTNSTDDAAKLWAALRGQADSQSLGMTITRYIGRMPYGAKTDPVESFDFEEFEGEPEHDGYLWTNASFVVATLLAQSFAEYEWEMKDRLIQDIDGLPLHTYKRDGETTFQPCAEIPMTDVGANKLMDFGLMPLVSYRGTDRVKLARFQSITDPVEGLKARW